MKRTLVVLFVSLLTSLAHAQNHVFVLVDISKSVVKSDLIAARQTLTDVLLGNALSNAVVAYGNAQDLSAGKLLQGDKLYILPFGNKQTVLNNPPSPVVIQTLPGDVTQQITLRFPANLTDNRTYLLLAKSKVAEYAKNNGIRTYKLFMISDNRQDDFGSNGTPDYTDYEIDLTQSYGTTSSGIEAPPARLKLTNGINKLYTLDFIQKVDVTKYNLPGTSLIIDTAPPSPVIKLTSNAGGKKNKEVELKSDNLNINWACTNCPRGGKFNVIISEYDGGKFREVKRELVSGFSIKVPDGKFRITVSAQNFTAASDTTYVKVSTGSFGWLIALLVIAALAGAAYYFWNKKRQQKLDQSSTRKEEDLFSKGTGTGSSSSSTTNSSNSEYF